MGQGTHDRGSSSPQPSERMIHHRGTLADEGGIILFHAFMEQNVLLGMGNPLLFEFNLGYIEGIAKGVKKTMNEHVNRYADMISTVAVTGISFMNSATRLDLYVEALKVWSSKPGSKEGKDSIKKLNRAFSTEAWYQELHEFVKMVEEIIPEIEIILKHPIDFAAILVNALIDAAADDLKEIYSEPNWRSKGMMLGILIGSGVMEIILAIAEPI